MPRFEKTFCSQCGEEFGPGDSGFSHCDQHAGKLDADDLRNQIRRSDEWSPGVKKAMEHFWDLTDKRSVEPKAQ
jgi:hypothetical protein